MTVSVGRYATFTPRRPRQFGQHFRGKCCRPYTIKVTANWTAGTANGTACPRNKCLRIGMEDRGRLSLSPPDTLGKHTPLVIFRAAHQITNPEQIASRLCGSYGCKSGFVLRPTRFSTLGSKVQITRYRIRTKIEVSAKKVRFVWKQKGRTCGPRLSCLAGLVTEVAHNFA